MTMTVLHLLINKVRIFSKTTLIIISFFSIQQLKAENSYLHFYKKEWNPKFNIISNDIIEFSESQLRDLKINLGIESLIPTQCGIRLQRFIYSTHNLNGSTTTTSGLIVIPLLKDNRPISVVSYQHGTMTGGNKVPSNIFENYSWRIGATLGGSCFLTLAADYLGLGQNEDFQAYLHARSEAEVSRDLLIQGIKFVRNNYPQIELTHNLFIWGHSQGGHAALSLHRLLENSSEKESLKSQLDLSLTGTVAASSPIILDKTAVEVISSLDPSPNTIVYGALLFYSMNKIYHFAQDIHDYIREPYGAKIDELFDGKKEFQDVAKSLPTHPNQFFTDGFLHDLKNNPNHPFLKNLRENNLNNWLPEAPLMLLHGQADKDVPYFNSLMAYQEMVHQGAHSIEFKDLGKDSDHRDAYLKSMISGIKWFNSLKNSSEETLLR